MNDEKQVARRALDFQARARDYRLMDIPAYREWSERRLAEGISEALIAHLDATSMCLLPEDVSSVTEETFDEMLEEFKTEIADDD
jgi:hypothetical protein